MLSLQAARSLAGAVRCWAPQVGGVASSSLGGFSEPSVLSRSACSSRSSSSKDADVHSTTVLCVRKDGQASGWAKQLVHSATGFVRSTLPTRAGRHRLPCRRPLPPLPPTALPRCLPPVQVVLVADGQVTMGGTVVKPNVRKTRKIGEHVVGGFAGACSPPGRALRHLNAPSRAAATATDGSMHTLLQRGLTLNGDAVHACQTLDPQVPRRMPSPCLSAWRARLRSTLGS